MEINIKVSRLTIMKRIFIIAVVVFICLVLFSVYHLNREMQMMRKHSSLEALRTSLIIELDSYYQENGVYPNSLANLTDIEYSDGATPDMLKAFHYESNGDSYKLLYYSSYYGKEVEVTP